MFGPTYLKQAKLISTNGRKLLRYRRDLLKPEQLAETERLLDEVDRQAKEKSPEGVTKAIDAVEAQFGKIVPERSHPAWRENCEVLLVAIAIAIGIRAYFLQPFKIPTGSMQPTLNGINVHPMEAPPPNALQRFGERLLLGRTYLNLVSAIDDNQIVKMTEVKRFYFFTYTVVECKDGSHTLQGPLRGIAEKFGMYPNRKYAKGEVIARGRVDTGDQVFVDKLTYHFRNPTRGEVFVFTTKGVPTRENRSNPGAPSQFYIKRLGGKPGDRLRIDPPNLYINGELAKEPAFRRVMNAKDGYRGYSNAPDGGSRFEYLSSPEDTLELPKDAYFALGDNSYNSSDSRDWGIVPEQNLVGRGLLVYWPFTSHWGLIR